MAAYEERRIKAQVISNHATTDTLIVAVDSKLTTVKGFTDTLESTATTIGAQTDTLESTAATIKGFTDTLESKQATIESKIDSIGGNNVESKVDTVKTFTDTVESQNDTNEALLGTVNTGVNTNTSKLTTVNTSTTGLSSQLNTNEAAIGTANVTVNANASKLDTVKLFTDGLESQLNTNETLINAIATSDATGSKQDTIKSGIVTIKMYTDAAESMLNTNESLLTTVSLSTDTVESQNNTNETILNNNDSKLSTLINSVTGIQNNMLTKIAIPSVIERPDTGSSNFRIWAYNYDSAGNMAAPDVAPTIKITDSSGSVIIAEVAMTSDARTPDAIFRYDWSIASTLALQSYYVEVKTTEAAVVRYNGQSAMLVENSGIVGEITSKHATTDTLLTSMLNTNETVIGTVDTTVTANASKLTTIKTFTDTVESQNDTNESLLNTVKTSVSAGDASSSKQLTIQSLLTTVKGFTDTVESQNNTNEALLNTAVAQTDTVESKLATSGSSFSQFEEAIFLKTAGTINADGNLEEEIATLASTQTAINDAAIMASKVIGQGMGSLPVRSAYIDVGWTGVTSASTGDSKLMVVAGSTATVAGAVDLSGVTAESTVKGGRWISGQIKLAEMNTLPFTVMLLGKVLTGGTTLTCTGYAGSTVTIVHELS